MRPWTILYCIAATAALSISATGCSGGSDKSGGDAAAPTTLRLATMEGTGSPDADNVEEFARQVEKISSGGLRIRVIWSSAEEFFGTYPPGAEQKVARLIRDGKVDLGLVSSRAWDGLGVTSLQALQAPFLVSSDDLVDEVVQSDVAEEMLTGL